MMSCQILGRKPSPAQVAVIVGFRARSCAALRSSHVVRGLVGHIHEEQRKMVLRALWESAERALACAPEGSGPEE
jgi:hypothetical protein